MYGINRFYTAKIKKMGWDIPKMAKMSLKITKITIDKVNFCCQNQP